MVRAEPFHEDVSFFVAEGFHFRSTLNSFDKLLLELLFSFVSCTGFRESLLDSFAC